eukprot:CAMPEP_0172304974 /NCGR_PEP_ID=MMETSP1058-20130122/6303_1 /TAXON_ID=83371 /ORGANISM="Detonula confervacea, Strain CCMP 353" /LENGTH=1138 /DNA_ID=CAMNT_0013016387 /DNA_START=108 /DNA_END=3524 /DNA_ORIENTATION=-
MSGGWDDDDDLLAMLDDDDDDDVDVVGDEQPAVDENVHDGIVDGSAVAAAPPANTATTANPFLKNDDDGAEEDDMNEDGWDDDDDLDLDGLSSENEDNNVAGQEEDEITTAVQPPPPQPQHQSSQEDNDNVLDTTLEKTLAMFQEHEEIMEREIGSIISHEEPQQPPQEQHATAQNEEEVVDNDEEEEEEWDFDEDSDIFNEGNDELDLDLDDGEGMLEDDRVPTPPPLPPATMIPLPVAAAAAAADVGWDEQPQQQQLLSQEVQQSQQQLSKNPFLSTEIDNDRNENHGPPSAEEINDSIINSDNGADADGWSDEDFFDDDDIITQSVTPPPPHPAPVPPPPPFSSLTTPIAQRTLANTTAQHQQQQQQQQSVPHHSTMAHEHRKPPPAPLNPNQRKIHQMLYAYIATLHDPNFSTRLHQKLHLFQTTSPSGTNTNGNANNNSAASDLKTYYATRPGLRKYTLGVELDRMDYQLILQNGKSVQDKDVVRSYFGVSDDGERVDGAANQGMEGEEEATTEELLVRSANQSLLADMLVALTGSEEDVITGNSRSQSPGLVLSGPTLCMTSVAESCQFKVDLQCEMVEAVCCLAINIPFHPNGGAAIEAMENVVENGRLVLARAQVSVRFRPGGEGGDVNDEPTVQYAVQSVKPFHTPDSMLVRQAAISLANDLDDPFFHNEFEVAENDEAADARDRFLLSHHLADSGMLVVSDHIDKLRDAAEASSSGFRSALRQLDTVTNVSAKLQGFGTGFGLALPSVEEIEAAERESAGDFAQVPPPPNADFRFPRPDDGIVRNDDPSMARNLRPPRPPPPPMPPQAETAEISSSRPRPLIGGLFMSGLSRLAAAATQPDDQHNQQQRSSWEGGGGTGLTPPSSPPKNSNHAHFQGNEHPTLYQRDEYDSHAAASGQGRNVILPQPLPPLSGGDQRGWDNEPTRGYTGLTPLAAQRPPPRYADRFEDSNPPVATSSRVDAFEDHAEMKEHDDDLVEDGEDDAGWSDDEFDFEDEPSNHETSHGEACSKETEVEKVMNAPAFDGVQPGNIFFQTKELDKDTIPVDISPIKAMPIPPPPPPPPPQQKPLPNTPQQRTFEEEFVIVLKDKIDAECQEMKETGRMKRWTPIREDPVLRQRLMEVMVAQIHS